MSGIAGVLSFGAPVEASRIRSLCSEISHRGPWGTRIVGDERFGAGVCLPRAAQTRSRTEPATNEDGTVMAAVDAWLVNAADLRRNLTSGGHTFRSDSDAEVAVHLYEETGLEGLSRLRGPFALCLWDSGRGKLLLARDRMGERPLFYCSLPSGIAFASELRALREAGLPATIDEDGIRLYLSLHFIPEPHTAFAGARKVLCGGWVLCDVDGRIDQGRYWRLSPPAEPGEKPPGSVEAVCERIREVFDQAVKERIGTNIPAAVLSGGLDSSSVVAAMALQVGAPVVAYTARYEEKAFDETDYASMLARQYGCDHRIVTIRPDSVIQAARAVRHLGEPNGDTSAVPTLVLASNISKTSEMVLTGDGGDEMFGGYESYADVERSRWMDRIPLVLRRLLSNGAEWLPYSYYGKNWLGGVVGCRDGFDRFFAQTAVPYNLQQRLFPPRWRPPGNLGHGAGGWLEDFLLRGQSSPICRAMYFMATANFCNGMLPFVDRMTRAHSVETQHPFLDPRVIDLAWSLPADWKLRNGQLKWIWRKAVGDRLPPALLRKRKTGFDYPLSKWFRTSLREFVYDHLLSAGFINRGFVIPEFLRYLIREHEIGRRDNHRIFWSLLMLEFWLRDIEQPAQGRAA